MLTVVHVWLASSFVFAAVLLVDQLRRPVTAWAAAGRQRRFWVTLTLLMGFHGLGPFAAAGYLTVVVPRFRAGGPVAQPRPAAQWMGRAAAVRGGQRTATEALVLVAALLIFASSFIHAAVIADHFDYWVPFGLAFAIATGAQAAWVALVYRAPLDRRYLIAGALGNGVLVAVWGISRTVGLPVGPQPWTPEPVGGADVFSTLDELMAVVLIVVVLAASRGGRIRVSRLGVRIASLFAGPLFIWSILGAFGAEHHH